MSVPAFQPKIMMWHCPVPFPCPGLFLMLLREYGTTLLNLLVAKMASLLIRQG